MIETTNIYVTTGFSRWHVKEEGFDAPIATFTDEKDAVDYAIALARTKPAASVSILDERGKVTMEKNFAMQADH